MATATGRRSADRSRGQCLCCSTLVLCARDLVLHLCLCRLSLLRCINESTAPAFSSWRWSLRLPRVGRSPCGLIHREEPRPGGVLAVSSFFCLAYCGVFVSPSADAFRFAFSDSTTSPLTGASGGQAMMLTRAAASLVSETGEGQALPLVEDDTRAALPIMMSCDARPHEITAPTVRRCDIGRRTAHSADFRCIASN
jgi:hypothetical protein